MTKEKLEQKILELENKRAEMEDEACYILADILDSRIEDLKTQIINL